MPQPSSVTRISVLPPSACATSMRVAPASSAFSTSSLTAEAGRSTTSPAAMRFIAASSSCRIAGRFWLMLGLGLFMYQYLARAAPILPETHEHLRIKAMARGLERQYIQLRECKLPPGGFHVPQNQPL